MGGVNQTEDTGPYEWVYGTHQLLWKSLNTVQNLPKALQNFHKILHITCSLRVCCSNCTLFYVNYIML